MLRYIAQVHGQEVNIAEVKPSSILALRQHLRAIFSVQCTSVSGTLTGLLQRKRSAISGYIFSSG